MKRDMNLVRDILLKMEQYPFNHGVISNFRIDGISEEDLEYHLTIMDDASLIEVSRAEGAIWPIRITWEGQEFLENARNDEFWNNTKKHIRKKALPATIEVFKMIFSEIIKSSIKDTPPV